MGSGTSTASREGLRLATVAGCLFGCLACVLPALDYPSLIGLSSTLLAVVVTASIAVDAMHGRFDPCDAKNVFASVYLLYVLPWPILVYFGSTPELLDVTPADEWYVAAATGLACLALVAFYLGNALCTTPAQRALFSSLGREDVSRLVIASCALTAATLCLLGWYITDVGGVRNLLEIRYRIFEFHHGRTLSGIWLNLLPVNLLLLYYLATRYRRIGLSIPIFVLTTAGVVLLLWLGRRRHLTMFLLSAVVYRHYAVSRFKLWQIVVGAVGGFAFLNLLGVLRTGELDQLFDYALEAVESGTVFYALTGAGEFSTASAWLPFAMQAVRTRGLEYLYGSSYLLIPSAFVPRALYPDRPLGLSEWYTLTFFPETGAQGGSIAVPLLAEAYLNFGAAGVLSIALVIGGTVGWLRSRLLCADASGVSVESRGALMYATIVGWTPSIVRVDLGAWLKEYAIYWLATMIVVFFVSAGNVKNASDASRG